MRVKAVKDIRVKIATDFYFLVCEGDEFDLPRYGKATEWLAAGLVVPVREEKIEMAVRTPQERAITR